MSSDMPTKVRVKVLGKKLEAEINYSYCEKDGVDRGVCHRSILQPRLKPKGQS